MKYDKEELHDLKCGDMIILYHEGESIFEIGFILEKKENHSMYAIRYQIFWICNKDPGEIELQNNDITFLNGSIEIIKRI